MCSLPSCSLISWQYIPYILEILKVFRLEHIKIICSPIIILYGCTVTYNLHVYHSRYIYLKSMRKKFLHNDPKRLNVFYYRSLDRLYDSALCNISVNRHVIIRSADETKIIAFASREMQRFALCSLTHLSHYNKYKSNISTGASS